MDELFDEQHPLSEMPEYKLVVAKLRQHVEDAVRKVPQDKPYKRRIAEEERDAAMAWIMSDDTAPWSACWCADLMELDIDRVRDELLNRPNAVRSAMRFRRGKVAA